MTPISIVEYHGSYKKETRWTYPDLLSECSQTHRGCIWLYVAWCLEPARWSTMTNSQDKANVLSIESTLELVSRLISGSSTMLQSHAAGPCVALSPQSWRMRAYNSVSKSCCCCWYCYLWYAAQSCMLTNWRILFQWHFPASLDRGEGCFVALAECRSNSSAYVHLF
jgi:hypothetical protein